MQMPWMKCPDLFLDHKIPQDLLIEDNDYERVVDP